MAAPDKDIIKFGPWPNGANNIAREDSLPAGAVRAAVNVDFYPGGKVRRRAGSEASATLAGAQNLWSDGHYALCTSGASLYRFTPGQPLKLIYVGLQYGADVCYCTVNQYVYVSDGITALRVNTVDDSAVSWGVATPLSNPVFTATANGGFEGGTYQGAITWARIDGEESGALLSSTVVVSDGGGISLSQFPPPPSDVVSVQVYLTKANGTEETLVAMAPANVATAQLFPQPMGRPLRNQLLAPLPAGTDAEVTLGRFFIARDNYVMWSEVAQYGLWKPKDNHVAFAEPVVMVCAVSPMAQSQGLFVATKTRTYFLQGTDPYSFANAIAYGYGAVPNSNALVPGSYFENSAIPNVPLPVWISTNGFVCVGMPDGTVRPMTDGKFAMSTGDRGAAIARELNGIRQLLFSMRPATGASRLVAKDTVTIARYQNGVMLQ